VFRTHEDAPRVLIANSNLVPAWATWEHFNELDRKGLMMYGQMTAGSWIYIGSQGIVQGTYETFVEAGRQHFGGIARGRWILTGGLGGMGGAQPLAGDHGRRLVLAVECQPAASRSVWRPATSTYHGGYARRGAGDDPQGDGGEEGHLASACSAMPPRSSRAGARAACVPDIVTDQTSAHDPGQRLSAAGWTLSRNGKPSARAIPPPSRPRPRRSMVAHVQAMLDFQKMGGRRRLRQQHPPDGQG
jgi:urocanate hydratase